MAKGKAWSKHRADRQKENWTKARKREQEYAKAGHPGVAPRTNSGHSIGGYSIKKYGAQRAAELAGLKTRRTTTRSAARRALKKNRPTAVAA